MTSPKVLIIGGGISGLALAHGLQKHNIPFHIYERDLNSSFRAQGYRIRVAGAALDALEYLLSLKTYQDFQLTCADMRIRPAFPQINAQTGKPRESIQPGGSNGPGTHRHDTKMPATVDRTLFREVLLRGLKGDCISFGKAFERYEEEFSSNSIKTIFSDGTTATGTLLVAADGANSHVRSQYIPNHQILDTGGRCIYGKTPLTSSITATLPPEIMGGMSGITDRSTEDIMSLILEPVTFPRRSEVDKAGYECPEDYLYWVLATQPRRMGMSSASPTHLSSSESEKLAITLTENWHPSLRTIFRNQAPNSTSFLTLSSVLSDFGTWEPNPRLTLLGDAVHLMGPTAGSGAITALRDAHTLCKLLVEKGQSKEAIGDYERQMREYAGKAVELSWMAAKHIFGVKGEVDDRPLAEVMVEVREKRG